MPVPIPLPSVPVVDQQPSVPADGVGPSAGDRDPLPPQQPMALAPQQAIGILPPPVPPVAAAQVEKLIPDGFARMRMTIGSGGVDACCRLVEPGKYDQSLFSTGDILKVGLLLPPDAFTDGGLKRDAVVKSNSARTRLRNVEGGHKFRILGLSTVNETAKPVATAYLCSTLLLSLQVKPDICAEACTSGTRAPKVQRPLPPLSPERDPECHGFSFCWPMSEGRVCVQNTQDKRTGGQPATSTRRPLDEFDSDVVKEHLVRNPHLITQAIQVRASEHPSPHSLALHQFPSSPSRLASERGAAS